MGYIQANLLPDEQIVYKARLHWVIFWKCCALVFLGAIFLLIQPIVGVVVILIGVLGALWPIMAYSTSEFAVTNKRVISKPDFCAARRWSCSCGTWKRFQSIRVSLGGFSISGR